MGDLTVKAIFLPQNAEKNPEKILAAITTKKITMIHFVPAMLSIFLDFIKKSNPKITLSSLRYIIASGEILSRNIVNTFNHYFQDQECELINLYGPTEATIDVTHYNCSNHSPTLSVPIGKAINNIECFVINKFQNLQGIGMYGELYLGGLGLAKGYINNPELTKEVFYNLKSLNNKLFYKTGDIVRLNVNGELEFKERKDNQIKLNGYRIELPEIEETIKQHPDISNACVILKTTEKNTKIIIAFCIKSNNVTIDNLDIIQFLKKHIPLYMLPHMIEFLFEFPLNMSGKIDKKKLLSIPLNKKEEKKEPLNDNEKKLSHIFQEVLESYSYQS